MKRAAILILLGLLCSAPAARAAIGYAVGDTAADLIAPDQNGTSRCLSEFAGKWVLLDVCAAWSEPSREMAIDAESVHDTWGPHPGISFEYVTCLSQGASHAASTQQDAAQWAKRTGRRWPVLHDEGGSAALTAWLVAAGIATIPTQVFVGPDRVIYMTHVGYRSPDEIAADVSELMRATGTLPPPDPARIQMLRTLPSDPR